MMKMKQISWFRMVLFGSFVFILVACRQAGESGITNETQLPPATDPISVNDSQNEPEKNDTQMTQSISPPGMETLIEEAKEDLADRMSIEIAKISLVEAKEVVWPDASLGCPQPGMKYKQVPEDGALIILQAQGAVYEYHSGGSRGLFLCEKIFESPKKPPQIDITKLTPPSPDNSIPPGEDQ
jgi:hypothetical protein